MTENTSASLVDSLMEDSSDEDILAAMRAAIVRLERYDESTDDELNALFLRKGFNAVLLPILRKLYRANYPRTTGGVPKGAPIVAPTDVTVSHLRQISVPFPEGSYLEALRLKPVVGRLAAWVAQLREMLLQGPPDGIKGPCPLGELGGALGNWMRLDSREHSLFLDVLYVTCVAKSTAAMSEDDMHSLLDSLVKKVMESLALVHPMGTMVLVRNKKNRASARSVSPQGRSTEGTRPDVGGYTKGVMLLMAEEKDGDIDEALADIRRKANFNAKERWGGLWFHFGYIADRNTFQFLLVVDTASIEGNPSITNELVPGEHVRIFPLSPLYNTSSTEDKQNIAVATINLFRAILTLLPNITRVEGSYSLPKKMDTGTEVEVRVGSTGDHLYKRFMLEEGNYHRRWLEMVPFYQMLKGHDCPSLVKVEGHSIKGLNVTLKLTPVGLIPSDPGTPRLPKTEEQLRAAVRCTLQALHPIHAIKWAHCDIRWPNVVPLNEQLMEWLLIDLEFASPWGRSLDNLKAPPPEKISSVASDVFMVGALVQEVLTSEYSGACRAFAARLMAQRPEERPSVQQCLNDPWLQPQAN